MLANLAETRVEVAPHAETTLIGAGILGWVGLGRWPRRRGRRRPAAPGRRRRPEPRLRAPTGRSGRYQTALAGLKQAGGSDLVEEDSDG